MPGSLRGQTVSPSAQKELEDSCSQPADTDRNSDKHEDLHSHTTQQIVVEPQLPSFQTLWHCIVYNNICVFICAYIADVRLTDKLDYFFISWVQVHSEVPPISICLIKVDLYSCGTSSTRVHLCNTTCTCEECVIVHTDLDSRVIVCLYVKGGTSVHQLEVTDACMWKKKSVTLNAFLQLQWSKPGGG